MWCSEDLSLHSKSGFYNRRSFTICLKRRETESGACPAHLADLEIESDQPIHATANDASHCSVTKTPFKLERNEEFSQRSVKAVQSCSW